MTKIMDHQAADHEYLHKDFHGALAEAIAYLDAIYGPQATADYLAQVGRQAYVALIEEMKQEGLAAMARHLIAVFSKEQGRFTLQYEPERLLLEVKECPAISHLKNTGRFFSDRFCEATVQVNEAICASAGFRSSCTYEPKQGRCIQIFWKENGR
jgi:hypothetical protein